MSNVPMTPGCYIDGSHWSADDFDAHIIRLAQNLGWDGGSWDLDALYDAHETEGIADVNNGSTLSECLYDASEEAVAWMNEQRTDDLVWEVSESSLFLSGTDEMEGM